MSAKNISLFEGIDFYATIARSRFEEQKFRKCMEPVEVSEGRQD